MGRAYHAQGLALSFIAQPGWVAERLDQAIVLVKRRLTPDANISRHASWKRVKLTKTPVPIVLQVGVKCGLAAWRMQQLDRTGEMTLGDLASFLEEATAEAEMDLLLD